MGAGFTGEALYEGAVYCGGAYVDSAGLIGSEAYSE